MANKYCEIEGKAKQKHNRNENRKLLQKDINFEGWLLKELRLNGSDISDFSVSKYNIIWDDSGDSNSAARAAHNCITFCKNGTGIDYCLAKLKEQIRIIS